MLGVEVDHGERPTLRGDATRRRGRVDAVDLQLTEDGGVEGGRYSRGAGQVLGALSHAVVHVVAFGRNDPLVPLDILELDVQLSFAAHGHLVAAAQRALPDRVPRAVVAETHLGHHEGLVGGVGGGVEGAQVCAVLVAADLQPQSVLTPVQEGLQRARDGKRVPVALAHLQHLLHHQRAVGARRAAVVGGEEHAGGEAGVSVRVPRGARVDPQRRLEDLDAPAAFLQELEGKAETGPVATLRLVYGSTTVIRLIFWTFGIYLLHQREEKRQAREIKFHVRTRRNRCKFQFQFESQTRLLSTLQHNTALNKTL